MRARFTIGTGHSSVTIDQPCREHGGEGARWHQDSGSWLLTSGEAEVWFMALSKAGATLTHRRVGVESSVIMARTYAALGEIPEPVASVLEPCTDQGDPFWDTDRMGPCDVWGPTLAPDVTSPLPAEYVPLPVSDDAPWRAVAYAAFPHLAPAA